MKWQGIAGSAVMCMVLGAHLGCGGGSSDAGPGPSGGASDRRAFVPEGIEFESANVTPEDMKIEAATLQDSGGGAEWLIAVRNAGQELVCGLEVAAIFSGDAGGELAAELVPTRSPLYKDFTENGCLAPGEVSFGVQRISTTTAAPVTHILHQFQGYLPKEAMKLEDVGLDAVRVTSSSASSGTLRGQFRNASASPIWGVAVDVFSLNAVGRPIAAGAAFNTSQVLAGTAWDFEVSVPGPLDEYAVFASFPPQ